MSESVRALEDRRLPKSELIEWTRALREAGWSDHRIADELCISRSYVWTLRKDPDGRKDRKRKQRYGGTCEDCGARTDGSNGRARAPRVCKDCAPKRAHENRDWTRATILDSFKRFAETMGRPPAVADVVLATGKGAPSLARKMSAERIAEAIHARDLGLRLPQPSTVAREFKGGWREALTAAGMPTNPGGTPAARVGRGMARRLPKPAVVLEPSAAYSEFRRGDFVCPSCGEFSTVLYELTGWCGKCTRAQTRSAA